MKKIDIKAGVSWLVYILYNKVFLKVSLSIYYPIAIFKPLLGKISLEFSWTTGWCLGKNIFDFSGSDFVIGNFFRLFLVHILLILYLFLSKFIKRFLSELTKIMPNEKFNSEFNKI